MGTRNLTAVMFRGDYRLAQYGQWDGYPEGQGATALAFCRQHLTTAAERAAFAEKLNTVRFVSDEEMRDMWALVGVKRDQDFVTMDEADAFDTRWPHFSRNHGAKILGLVAEATGEVLVSNALNFAADSLFCEWAYVIDLDRETFEVYEGFNKDPLPPTERFAHLAKDGEYHPIRMVKCYSLNDLPSKAAFLADLRGDKGKDDDA